MIGLSYAKLDGVSKSVPPYRGSLNRFPLGARRQNNKYFFVRDEDGQRVFDIVNGEEWLSVDITKEECDERTAKKERGLHSYTVGNETRYYRYDIKPFILGVVRPDNTFEFTGSHYGQGSRSILSAYTVGWFTNDSRRGGMVWRSGSDSSTNKRMFPIYKGLRVICGTMKPTKPIRVIGKKVDRKVGKDLLAAYKDFYTVTEVMTKAMSRKSFLETAVEVVLQHVGKEAIQYGADWERLITRADSIVNEAPLDAFILYIMGFGLGSMRFDIRNAVGHGIPNSMHNEDVSPYDIFDNLKRRLNKEIYKKHKSVFKPVEYAEDKAFPPSEWGHTVMVDGVEVEQYA
jgi:hypothetical protein